MKIVIFSLIAFFCFELTPRAEDLSYLAKAMPRLESTLALYTGAKTSFTAQIEFTVTPSDGRPQLKIPATIYYTPDNLRCDLVESNKFSRGIITQYRKISLIFKAKESSLFVTEPDNQVFKPVVMSPSAFQLIADEKKNSNVVLSEVGDETIDGLASVKSQGVTKRGEVEVARTTVYYPKNGGVIPLKLVSTDTNQTVTISFNGTQVGSVSDDSFKVPAHFKKVQP